MTGGILKTDGLYRGKRKIAVAFDMETADEIIALAKKNGIRVAEQTRILVEWGLEDAKGHADSETDGSRSCVSLSESKSLS